MCSGYPALDHKLEKGSFGFWVVEGLIEVALAELDVGKERHGEELVVRLHVFEKAMLDDKAWDDHGEGVHAVEDEGRHVGLRSRELSPWKEPVVDDAGDVWEEGGEGLLEVGLEEFGGMNEGEEEGHGRKRVGAFYTRREVCVRLRERKLEDCGFGVVERGADEGRVCRCGEDGDGDVSIDEEVGKVDESDGVAFGHERKEHNMGGGRRRSSSSSCSGIGSFNGSKRSRRRRRCDLKRSHLPLWFFLFFSLSCYSLSFLKLPLFPANVLWDFCTWDFSLTYFKRTGPRTVFVERVM